MTRGRDAPGPASSGVLFAPPFFPMDNQSIKCPLTDHRGAPRGALVGRTSPVPHTSRARTSGACLAGKHAWAQGAGGSVSSLVGGDGVMKTRGAPKRGMKREREEKPRNEMGSNTTISCRPWSWGPIAIMCQSNLGGGASGCVLPDAGAGWPRLLHWRCRRGRERGRPP